MHCIATRKQYAWEPGPAAERKLTALIALDEPHAASTGASILRAASAVNNRRLLFLITALFLLAVVSLVVDLNTGDTTGPPYSRLVRQAIDRFSAWKFEAGEELLERVSRSGASTSTSRPGRPTSISWRSLDWARLHFRGAANFG